MTLEREALIARTQSAAAKLGKQTVSRAELKREAGITAHCVRKHFSNHGALLAASGLEPPLRSAARPYGPFLHFRGLHHAPTSEAGVIFLFGMVAQELGFVVESITAAFPDCEAKRRVDRRGEAWQRVRIEFEHQSRSFREHDHDPSGCDLIVCWEHNWPDCPLEVIALKDEIARLEQTGADNSEAGASRERPAAPLPQIVHAGLTRANPGPSAQQRESVQMRVACKRSTTRRKPKRKRL